MPRQFERVLEPSLKTFLPLGPRGTGKSTWLARHFPRAPVVDLLHTEQLFRYRAQPALIRSDLAHLRPGDWAVIDEAQKVPELLDEIHGLYESRRINFAITGSSARKLRRADVNLLAGRALRCDFFPLAWCEIDRPSLLPSCLDFGTLPHVLGDPAHAADTPLAFRLRALRLGMRSKEAAHAKFYVFDAGVARAAAGWARETMPEEWKGYSFETLVLGELRAFNSYRRKDKQIFHYTVTGGFDVDFVVETEKKVLSRPARYVAIEAKAAARWKPEWSAALRAIAEHGRVAAAYGVYLGTKTIVADGVTVMPFPEFSKRLWAEKIFS